VAEPIAVWRAQDSGVEKGWLIRGPANASGWALYCVVGDDGWIWFYGTGASDYIPGGLHLTQTDARLEAIAKLRVEIAEIEHRYTEFAIERKRAMERTLARLESEGGEGG
jgi:hypothetical protein